MLAQFRLADRAAEIGEHCSKLITFSKRLFAHYLERVKARRGINLERLAEMTVNFSPAEV